MAKTDIVEKEAKENQLAVTEADFDYGDEAHEGFEDTTINDLSIPFLNILQTNSPEVEDQTIPGCKAGDIVNSVTREIMKQPIIFLPVKKEEVWVKWRPRNQGGGLQGRHKPTDAEVQEVITKNGGSRIPPKDAEGKRIPFKTSDGNELVETHYFYGLILDENGEESESYGVLAFSSTKIKVQKDWMTSMYTIKGAPPMRANRAAVTTVKQKAEGGSFFNFAIGPLKDSYRASLIPKSHPLFEEGKTFKEMIEMGLAQADFNEARDTSDAGVANTGATKERVNEDDIPF